MLLLRRHILDEHQSGAGEQDNADIDELLRQVVFEDEDVMRTYRRHIYAIATRREKLDARRWIYNFPLADGEIDVNRVMTFVREIYHDQNHPFKINLGLGFILDHINRQTIGEDNLFSPRYYHPYRNSAVLRTPFTLSTSRDLGKLTRKLESLSFMEDLTKERPDTKWVLSLLTNISFDVTSISLTKPLGCTTVRIPDFLQENKSVKNIRVRESNNLCFFNCLSFLKGARAPAEITRRAVEYYRTWKNNKSANVASFPGVMLWDFDSLEETFEINITVYSMSADGRVETVRASTTDYDESMHLNVWQNHLMLVTKPFEFC